MQGIIEVTASDELLNALESNRIAYWSAYGRAKGSTLIATPEIIWFYTGIQVPLFNGVLSAKLKPNDVRVTLDNLQAKIVEQRAPALWWIGPRTTPDNLGSLLEQYGLQPAWELPGMAIDLEAVEDQPKTISNFTIEKVSSVETQALWARICAVGTGFPDRVTEDVARLEATLTDPEYKAQHRYVGFLNGTPVATSALVVDSGIAGIYAVATIPEARRQGIGRMMTVMPLLEARQLGYRVGVLQASPMGFPIYKAIGFQDVCSSTMLD